MMEIPPNLPTLFAAVLAVIVAGILVWRFGRRSTGRRIRVVGVGGAGTNAVEAMIDSRLKGVEYVVVNTDVRSLGRSSAGTRIAIGRPITNGLGAGGDSTAGEVAARDATDQISRALAGSDFVVITAGLGGGTGSGAAPVVAEIARQQGALTMAVVTLPFAFEGSRRKELAQSAASALAGKVDAVATIPNDRVRDTMPAGVTIEDAFKSIDEALCRSVGEVLDLVAKPGRMNLDFADVRAVLQGGGAAAVGIGRASGESRAVDAARKAMETAMPVPAKAGPTSILVNVAGSSKLRLNELDAVGETILATAGRNANLVFGVSLRPRLRDDVQVTIIATGLDRSAAGAATAAASEAEPAWRPVWLRRATTEPRPGAASGSLTRPRRKAPSPVEAATAESAAGDSSSGGT